MRTKPSITVTYAVFAAIVFLWLSVCYLFGWDTFVASNVDRKLRAVQPAALLVLSLSVVFLLRASPPPVVAEGSRAFPLATSGATLLASAAIALVTLQAVPLSGDEGAYVYLADLLGRGRVSLEAKSIQPYIAQSYIFQHGDKLISQYPPGWSGILALAGKFGLPYALVNPVCGSLTLLALWRFAAAEHGRGAALLACAITAACGFFCSTRPRSTMGW